MDNTNKADVHLGVSKVEHSLGRLLFMMVIGLPLRAVVASWFWFWFIVPLGGWPVLTAVQSFGVLLAAHMFVSTPPHRVDKDERSEADKWTVCLMQLPGYLFIWGIGYVFFKLVYR